MVWIFGLASLEKRVDRAASTTIQLKPVKVLVVFAVILGGNYSSDIFFKVTIIWH